MTVLEQLAEKALPCNGRGGFGCERDDGLHYSSCSARSRAAAVAALRELLELAARVVEDNGDEVSYVELADMIRKLRIRALGAKS